jgi:hypothetical protein
MFYLLKNLLLFILIIFKLKCNNLIFNEIMILNASYVCLHAFSLRRESPDPDPRRRTLISEVVLSHRTSNDGVEESPTIETDRAFPSSSSALVI